LSPELEKPNAKFGEDVPLVITDFAKKHSLSIEEAVRLIKEHCNDRQSWTPRAALSGERQR
jgi:hypothetical protein